MSNYSNYSDQIPRLPAPDGAAYGGQVNPKI